MTDPSVWPELRFDQWRPTYHTLHLWLQVAGKIRLVLSPLKNHWWYSTLYVTSRGLTTGPIPYAQKTFDVTFDFIDHQLRIDVSDGGSLNIKLEPKSVAAFYREVMAGLRSLGLEVAIWTTPVEFLPRTPFGQDDEHVAYDRPQPKGSGASCSRPTACSGSSTRVSWASRARSISSGVASTWR
jgi:hypothetical protein